MRRARSAGSVQDDSGEVPPVIIDIHFKGDGKGEPVDATDFVDFLAGSLTTLRKLEQSESPGTRPRIEYTLVDLKIGSATVAIRGEAPSTAPVRPESIAQAFAEGLVALEGGVLGLLGYEPDIQRSFERLVRPLKRGLRSVSVAVGEQRIELLAERFKDVALEPDLETASMGSFSGFIDAINVHTEPIFYLYPVVGPSRIRCVFDRTLLESVRDALKHYATVYGLIETYEGNPFPALIVVERVEINPPESELPTLGSLWGIAPDLTGGIESTAFVRQLRDAQS